MGDSKSKGGNTQGNPAGSGANKSAELKAKLAGFLMDYLGSKVSDGITYVLLTSDKKDTERFNELTSLKAELDKAHVNPNVFRCYQVSNGYIFDVDIGVARDLTAQMAREVMNIDRDLIGDGPQKRRRADIERLAKSCKAWFNKGVNTVEVALFSRNSVPRINITGRDAKGAAKMLTYEAYAIRHWDIDEVNSILLSSGIRITAVDTHEILPSETGLRVTLHIALA